MFVSQRSRKKGSRESGVGSRESGVDNGKLSSNVREQRLIVSVALITFNQIIGLT